MKNVYIIERYETQTRALGPRWTAVCRDDDEMIAVDPSLRELINTWAAYLSARHEKHERLTITVEVGK